MTTVTIEQVATHRTVFSWLSWFAIGVSFFHMAAALMLFSGESPLDRVVSAAMTLLVDLIIWGISEYTYYCSTIERKPGCLVWGVLGMALLVSVGLNFSYLYAHRPSQLPELAQNTIPVVFALLIPAFIGTAGLVRGDLERDRAALTQKARTLQSLEDELRDSRAQATQAARDLEQARAELAQERAQAAQRSAEAARLVGGAAQERDELRASLARATEAAAQAAQEAAQLRGRIAQIEEERRAQAAQGAPATERLGAQLAEARQAHEQATQEAQRAKAQAAELAAQLAEAQGSADLPRLARALAAESVAGRVIARAFGKSESTVRSWISAAPQAA